MDILNTKNLDEKSDKDLERLLRNLSIEYKDYLYGNHTMMANRYFKRLCNLQKEYKIRGIAFVTDIKGL